MCFTRWKLVCKICQAFVGRYLWASDYKNPVIDLELPKKCWQDLSFGALFATIKQELISKYMFWQSLRQLVKLSLHGDISARAMTTRSTSIPLTFVGRRWLPASQPHHWFDQYCAGSGKCGWAHVHWAGWHSELAVGRCRYLCSCVAPRQALLPF